MGNFGANSVFPVNYDKFKGLRFKENTASYTTFIIITYYVTRTKKHTHTHTRFAFLKFKAPGSVVL